VVRTGAQTLDGLVTGSVEYGPLENSTPLVVVLGHQRCGAVTAAVAVLKGGRPRPPGRLGEIVSALRPACQDAIRAAAHAGDLVDGDLVDLTVRAQIRRDADRLASDPSLAARVRAGTLGVVGAYYSLDTGAVTTLSAAGVQGGL
jgi:carbonic anhydrase